MIQDKIKNRVMLVLLLGGLFMASCNQKENQSIEDPVARVNKEYLNRSELKNIVSLKSTHKDSVAIVHSFIDKWATKRLLIEAAEFNLSDDKKSEINTLVEQFKSDLLIKAYLEKLVQQSIDTIISEKDLETYYNNLKNSFLVDDMLVKMAYVNVLNDNTNYNKIKKKFTSSKKEEFDDLENMSLQMKSYALNDSIWVNVNQVYEKLPFLTVDNKSTYLKSGNYFEVQDDHSTYFVKINQVLERGSITPYDYLKPSLKQMVLNDRKMRMLKEIEEDILKDAKKNKRYEIF
jgi:hypothetical protein